ncbi:MAG: class I SAM-dependent methyltransferase [Rhodocyclaceae bacterium]|nr:class I SAM-dependent methyltransferase [Rhodocyclaceae bacterium]
MRNPWLDIPLADYEGHMAMPGIEQAQLLADIFSGALDEYSPHSVAILGCAGGNGFERISSAIQRVVGIDINHHFIAAAEARFGGRFKHLELIAGDIQNPEVSFAPVDLIFAGLIFEYVNVAAVIAKTPAMLTAAGKLVTVLQLPLDSDQQVSPSPFARVQTLGKIIRLVPPSLLQEAAESAGYAQLTSREVASRGGKRFQVQVFSK